MTGTVFVLFSSCRIFNNVKPSIPGITTSKFVAILLGDDSDRVFEYIKTIRQAVEDLHIPHNPPFDLPAVVVQLDMGIHPRLNDQRAERLTDIIDRAQCKSALFMLEQKDMEKILIIDDSPLQAAQLSDILSDEYEIETEQSAEAGFELARAGNYKFANFFHPLKQHQTTKLRSGA